VLWIGAGIGAAAVLAGIVLVAARREPAPAPAPAAGGLVTLAPVPPPDPTLAADTLAAQPTPTPLPPPVATGRVAVRAPYAVDVLWKGKLLTRASADAPYSLPVGRQPVTLSAPAHFLRISQTVEVHEDGVATLVAPDLGRVHIKANPDNCEVFIDGTFVDYPPILDKPIAAGAHTVSFKWADGSKTDYPIEVQAGAPAYVTGRKGGNR
jgi:hypothetical protein